MISVVFATTHAATASKYEAILRAELTGLNVELSSTVLSPSGKRDGVDVVVSDADIIVTLVTTLGAVRGQTAQLSVPIVPLFVELAGSFESIMRSFPPGVPLGVVANEYFLPTASALVAGFCANGVADVIGVAAEDDIALRALLRKSEVVVHTIGARDAVYAVGSANDRPDQRLIEVDYRPTRGSLDVLMDVILRLGTESTREGAAVPT
jgi:hypothetical protein